jgi:hypothetical protein
MISATSTMLLVMIFVVTNGVHSNNDVYESSQPYAASKMPELNYYDKYDELKADGRYAVVYPIITQSAYDWNGIHDYYAGYCDSCTSAALQTSYEKTFSSSGSGFRILEFLGYEVIDDIDIDKNPEILKNYDKIVLLHNEYVTEREFVAITSHPNVVYLYPNALVSKVRVDHTNGNITLLRGPSYPDPDVKNGFDWKYDNSEFFSDWNCDSWEFYPVENGHMLNCYPETYLPNGGYEMLKALKNL